MVNRFKIGTRIGAGFALGLTVLAVLGAVAYRTTTDLIRNAQQEKASYQILGYLNDLETDLVNAETGQRGYLITGQQRYLEPYENALTEIASNYELLRQLTVDDAAIHSRLVDLKPVIDARLARLRQGIQLRETDGFTAAQDFVLTNAGHELMQQLRDLIAELEEQERQLLEERAAQSQLSAQRTLYTISLGVPASFVLLSLVGWWLSRNISRPLRNLSDTAEQLADGNLAVTLLDSADQDETGILTRTFNQMVTNLRETIRANEEQRWLKSNLADLSQQLQGQRSLETLAELMLTYVATLVDAQQGVLYLLDPTSAPPRLKLLSSYAYQERKHLSNEFKLGEGLVGQCALEKQRIVLTEVPQDYIQIRSGLGSAPPLTIVVLPLMFENAVKGVLELASFHRFDDLQLTFLDEASKLTGVMINAIAAYMQTQRLLERSQVLTEELRQQQEELLKSNQLLEERTQSLQESELELQQQQEELQQSNEELQQLNEELEEKAELLETQKQQVERKNHEIERARQELEDQASQLAQSSRYKSEFLANMSHELRTPLNSLLILAKMLGDNSDGNLTEKQVDYSRTIHSAGVDLLSLINDILDMAKIESGTMEVAIESLAFTAIQFELERTFQPTAASKGLGFEVAVDKGLPTTLATDPRRLQQVLKNLISNAIKFTEHGRVTVDIFAVAEGQVAFAVTDTGIGILPEKQHTIFGAFQQADGTTSRRYGGTGLGLSISLQLAQLLGGSLELQSEPNQGSTFTLYLPLRYVAPSTDGEVLQIRAQGGRDLTFQARRPAAPELLPVAVPNSPIGESLPPLPANLEDDRARLLPGVQDSAKQVLLVIEDDPNFARILLDMARGQGFKVLIALQGQTGLALAQRFVPSAITLDLHLPDMDGLTVLEQLKHNPTTRHIPVHILTVNDEQQQEFQMGAIAHIQKPVAPEILTQTLIDIKQFVERRVRYLLVIEDDPVQAQSIIELIGGGDVTSTAVHTGAAALETLRAQPCDCIVLDLGLPDMNGFDLLEQIKQDPALVRLPIIVYTGKDLTEAEETQLRRLAETIIVKDVRSPERLLDETALFLHRVQANLPPTQQQMLERLQHSDPALAGKKVLIIDDDVRNIFALTSLLEQYDMTVVFAENGREGIETLRANADVGLVLMDVMMPELDGYETTRLIRKQEQYRSLPIIALTAKAMQGDREKCIEAGASDYITKPVDTEQLLTLLRLWLYQ
ncbi:MULTISPECIES: response regulator [Cyanophyceae]|uniref:response regulator n=1 Tax=Cyanophyceae TaxID=3028117 RepID=UPI001684D73F|nr:MULTISPECIES: response regulator [Cyanophyceae]MBD1918138.1 response regulator [Phormidium sp. FACHB-77]MBD2030170.1 response regulator [Phormidium sp. FACHB-322]MBD2051458.1 response regulator [Leptolyngbya sp. FACHB-60]